MREGGVSKRGVGGGGGTPPGGPGGGGGGYPKPWFLGVLKTAFLTDVFNNNVVVVASSSHVSVDDA